MQRLAILLLMLLLTALYVYFFGTPWVAAATGFSSRAVSLISGLAVVLFGLTGILLGRRSVQRQQEK